MKTLLVDMRNIAELSSELLRKFSVQGQLNGFDLETEDSRRHDGLNRAMKVDDDGHKGGNTKLLFDMERTTITGFSLYADKDDVAYYFNLAHADIENRIPFEVVRPLLDAIKGSGYFVAHKSPFELAMMRKCLGYDLGPKVLCTLQLAVTCWNDDTYTMEDFYKPGLGEGFKRLLPRINAFFQHYDGEELTSDQQEVLTKFIAKESDAEHSYNGYVNSIKYGYGLKRLSERLLGYKQQTFAETLDGKAHMGQLTGEEVAAYGADDAWVCMHLWHVLLAHLIATNPEAVKTYFEQENPMCYIYAETWATGVVCNRARVLEGQAYEREHAAQVLRKMKTAVRELLPFPEEPHEKLLKYDSKWKPAKYRKAVIDWANSPDSEDTFTQLMQTRTSLSKEWAESKGIKESSGLSITYYLVVRTIMYDLAGCSFQLADGKVQSDAEAQGKARERRVKKHGEDNAVVRYLDAAKELASTNQVVKLYINNYLNMIDPDTGRVYPHLSSMLNSRRMALEAPNLSQLAKNSSIAYVRSYFEADSEDEVLVSCDWSGLELVLIGDQSGDPEFYKSFGQLPHIEMHTPTTLKMMQAIEPELTMEKLKARPDFKKLRTDVGKGANFNYWYSGALNTVAQELGIGSDKMWEMVEGYRNLYTVAEAWRTGVIAQTQIDGFTQLPDKNVRYRFESTPLWGEAMRQKFASYGPAAMKYGELAIKKIRNRSGNQAVNSRIQGSNATLAKRSILRIDKQLVKEFAIQKKMAEVANKFRATFKFPVHDELVYSVHKDDALDFMEELWHIMCETHGDIVARMKLDAAMAVGKNYLAYDKDKNPKGQIELDEASKLPFIPEERWGKKMTREERQQVIEYLCQ